MAHAQTTPPESPSIWLSVGKRLLAPLLVIVLIASAAWREARERPLDFWTHTAADGDYVNICLAHALNIDFWLSKTQPASGRDLNATNTLHPGLPLQATSWIAYRLASPAGAHDAGARCEFVFNAPSAFWLATRISAIIIALISAALLARAAAPHGFLFSVAVGLIYFCYEPAWDYSIRLLGNETFALPLSLAVAWFASKSLTSPPGRSSFKWWACWGGLCALCWLNKLNYIAWAAAVVPASVAYFASRRPALAEMSLQLLVFAGGFGAAAYGLTTVMLGSGGLLQILHLHFGVLTHSGSYGNGPEGAVSLSAVQDAIRALSAYRPFLALSALICALSLWIAFADTVKRKVLPNNAPYLVYLTCAALLFLAATLKHFGPHYLIAGVPAISLLILALGDRIGHKGRLVLSLAICATLIHSYRRYTVIQNANYQREMEFKAGVRAVEDLPGWDRDGVLWSYRLPNRRFVMELVQYLAGVREVATVIDEKFPSPDLVYFLWIPNVRVGTETVSFDKARWRYAVFDRDCYGHFLKGEQANAREYFEKHCKRVVDGPQLTVFERMGE